MILELQGQAALFHIGGGVVLWTIHSALLLFGKSSTPLGQQSGDRSGDRLYKKPLAIATGIWGSFALLVTLIHVGMSEAEHVGWIASWPLTSVLINGWSLDFSLVTLSFLFFAFGTWLRLWAVLTLGDFFTFEIGIRSKQTLLETGPYRIFRHPSYTGYLFISFAMGLYSGHMALFLLLTLPVAAFFALRIHNEERMLVKHFGTSYQEYKKRTWAILPGL